MGFIWNERGKKLVLRLKNLTRDSGLITVRYKKDYIDTTTPTVYYNTNVTAAAGVIQKTSDYVYDETRRLPSPNSVSAKTTNTQTSISTPIVTTSKVYDNYGNVLTVIDALGTTTTFNYDTVTHWLSN